MVVGVGVQNCFDGEEDFVIEKVVQHEVNSFARDIITPMITDQKQSTINRQLTITTTRNVLQQSLRIET